MLVRIVTLAVAVAVAAVGAGLVLWWARDADDRARERAGPRDVVVAAQPIAAGTTVAQARADGSLDVAPVLVPETLDGVVTDPGDLDDIADHEFTTTVFVGEPILRGRIEPPSALADPLGLEPADAEAPPAPAQPTGGRAAVTIELGEAQRGSQYLRAGSRVAVLVTVPATGGAASDQTCVLLDAATIIAVGSETSVPDGGTAGEVPGTLVTVEVDQERAARLVHGQAQGPLYLVQRPLAGGPDFAPGTCYGDDDLGLSPAGPAEPAAPAEPDAPQAG